MEKYYTPEIEEFYVGFECELIDNDKTHKWSPIKCREETLYDVQSSHYNARVKYLDKEDIESLGWIKGYKADLDNYETKEHSCNSFEYIIKGIDTKHFSSRPVDYKLNFVDNEHTIKIQFYERNYFEWFPCFEGVIKNKSELQKIMKMLEIN